MKNLNLSQAYYLCAVNKKGVISTLNAYGPICFITSCLLELKQHGCITIEKKKVSINTSLDSSCAYLQPLYELIEKKKECSIYKLIEIYTCTRKHLNALSECIENSLVDKHVFDEIYVDNQKRLVPTKQIRMDVIEDLRLHLLNEDDCDDAVILATLLMKAGYLKYYISKEDYKIIKGKIRASEQNKDIPLIYQAVQCIDMLFLMSVAIIVFLTVI